MQHFRTLLTASAATLTGLGISVGITLGIALGLNGSAFAQGVKPAQNQTIHLGRITGDIYYTVAPDGYHVVATFAEPVEDATPVRFETILANNQSVTVSTPRHAGETPVAVEISRQSDQVIVRKAAEIN